MNKTTKYLLTSGAALALSAPMSSVLALEDSLSLGAWANYTYDVDDDSSEDRLGEVNWPSLNIYINHQHDAWFLDSELRIGSGSFQSFSGDDREWGFKELAFGRHLTDETTLTIGKTEVPFTYSRFNFWPGERLARGFGDQYNPGARLDYDPANNPMDMSFMFIKSQNWGTDTTSQDDGAGVGAVGQHWGSNDTYHKINTLVGDFGYTLGDFRHGFSVQAGQLANQDGLVDEDGEDLSAAEETETHFAAALYSEGSVGAWDLAGQVVHYDQGDVDEFDAFEQDSVQVAPEGGGMIQEQTSVGDQIGTRGAGQAFMLSAGYNIGDWFHYGDLTGRAPDSDFEDLDDTFDLVLGSRYNYGPGWIYAELNLQNITDESDGITGDIDDDGDREFGQTVNLTMDYYF